MSVGSYCESQNRWRWALMSKLIFLKLPKQWFKNPITVYRAITITYYIGRNVCGPFYIRVNSLLTLLTASFFENGPMPMKAFSEFSIFACFWVVMFINAKLWKWPQMVLSLKFLFSKKATKRQTLDHRFDTYYIMSNRWSRVCHFLWPS